MKLNKILSIIIIITIPYLILVGNFMYYLNNESFYYKQFEKNNVNVKDKELILDNLLNYFKDKETLEYFNEREQLHMFDVKVLINKFISVFYILIILDVVLFLFLFKRLKNFKKRLMKILFYSGILSLSIIITLVLLTINFDFIFDKFHKLLFFGDTYLFPIDSLIITLFPFNFFRNYFVKVLVNSFVMSFMLIALEKFINRKINK